MLWGYDAQGASDVTKHTRNFMSEGNNDDNGAEVWGYPRQLCELEGNKNLREIHATSVVPLELHGLGQGVDGYWDFLYEDCVLYVPEGSLEAYSSTAPWSNFKHILEETQASVDVVPVAGSKVRLLVESTTFPATCGQRCLPVRFLNLPPVCT